VSALSVGDSHDVTSVWLALWQPCISRRPGRLFETRRLMETRAFIWDPRLMETRAFIWDPRLMEIRRLLEHGTRTPSVY